jgi:restriction system protein
MASLKGPRFIQYFQPVLNALKDLGSSARPKEVYGWIAERLEIPQSDIEGINKGGQSKFENQVHWARFYLAKAGYIDTEQRGVWVLTEAGREAVLSHEQAHALFRQIHDSFKIQNSSGKSELSAESSLSSADDDESEDTTAPDDKIYLNQDEIQQELVRTLRSLSDKGFEELCARLLRHIGFENVNVTGRAGDEGIDGEGFLLINRFVRTKVMFQCKRYEGTVGPDKIRDFRGAIQGRAERGILLTTGTFTRGAVEAAARENATPIELVDIDELIKLLVEESLGVREAKALQIERAFFKPYM